MVPSSEWGYLRKVEVSVSKRRPPTLRTMRWSFVTPSRDCDGEMGCSGGSVCMITLRLDFLFFFFFLSFSSSDAVRAAAGAGDTSLEGGVAIAVRSIGCPAH